MTSCILTGGLRYWAWLGFLAVLIATGALAFVHQMQEGFIVTNLSDQVSWGAYIANFTFLVGVAAAAVLLVIPSYLYHDHAIKRVVLLGEILAVSAIIMCLLFISVDLGRLDRFWHILPGLGRLNFPRSILAWDVVVLNGYLLLNLHVPGYLLFQQYRGRPPRKIFYLPFVLISIAWAISIHTVTAFLFSGLGSRPYWNSAILAPRFLVSAFACGPALLTILFSIIEKETKFVVGEEVFSYLRKIMTYTLPINLFLLGCEVFKEFYTDSVHVASAQYLFFGLDGHGLLRPFIWSAILMEILAVLMTLFVPKARKGVFLVACGMTILGIWVEKGMGLIVPGFIPTPLGDMVEYTPSVTEILVCLGIWSLGALLFTVMSKVVIGISTGEIAE